MKMVMKDGLKLHSSRAAAALEHPRSRGILLELVAGERSLQELARVTGLSLSLLHYHVGRLRSLGLVAVASEERRAGRAVKRYRAVARRFFVPAALASGNGNDALGRELRAALERDRLRRDDAGVEYFVDAEGAPRMSRVRGPGKSRAFEAWVLLSLSLQEAEDLGTELRAVFARYSKRRGGRAVLAYCALAERKVTDRAARRPARRGVS